MRHLLPCNKSMSLLVLSVLVGLLLLIALYTVACDPRLRQSGCPRRSHAPPIVYGAPRRQEANVSEPAAPSPLEASASPTRMSPHASATLPVSDEVATLPCDELARVAQRVETAAVAVATPAPPQFEPLSMEFLPDRYWQPVFPGCQSVFTDTHCDLSYPTPRLGDTDLDELHYARSQAQGRANMVEPMRARQAMVQFLSVGVRARRDVYTQARPANDVAAQNPCALHKSKSPAYARH